MGSDGLGVEVDQREVHNGERRRQDKAVIDLPIMRAGFNRTERAQHVMVDFWKEVPFVASRRRPGFWNTECSPAAFVVE